MAKQPKILFLDIETAPKIATVWGRWNQNIAKSQIIHDSHVLCWAAKWAGKKKVYHDALYLHPKEYKKDPRNDKPILETVWKLVDEADIVVAHNGDRFDLPVLNARFVLHGMQPPSSYQSYDTLKPARRYFKFTSNRLDDVCQDLGLGEKLDTGGMELWMRIVLDSSLKDFRHMVKYNRQDVILLESLYEVLAPWDKKHPSLAVQTRLDRPTCNVCQSTHIQKRGFYFTNTQKYQRFKCMDCGHNMRSRFAEKLTKEQKHNLLRSN